MTLAQCWENVHKCITALRASFPHHSQASRGTSGPEADGSFFLSSFAGLADKVLAGDGPSVRSLLMHMRSLHLQQLRAQGGGIHSSDWREPSKDRTDRVARRLEPFESDHYGWDELKRREEDIVPNRFAERPHWSSFGTYDGFGARGMDGRGSDLIPDRRTVLWGPGSSGSERPTDRAAGQRGINEQKEKKSRGQDDQDEDWKIASLVDALPLDAAAFDSDEDQEQDPDQGQDDNDDPSSGTAKPQSKNAIYFTDSEWISFTDAGLDAKKATSVIKWAEGLGIRITVKDLETDGPRVLKHQFSDGVLICRLIQKLERSNPLPGFEPYPRTAAQRTQNLRRCIEHLARNNKKLTWKSLSFCEEDVLKGNIKSTFALLSDIKSAYSHR